MWEVTSFFCIVVCKLLMVCMHLPLRPMISAFPLPPSVQFSRSVVSNSATPGTAARLASLPITTSWSLLKLMSIESMMSSNHLILCRPLLLLPSIFPSIRVFSNKSALCIRWAKCWSFSFNISASSEYSGLMISLKSKGLSRVFSNTTVQKHQFFSDQLSLSPKSHIHTRILERP